MTRGKASQWIATCVRVVYLASACLVGGCAQSDTGDSNTNWLRWCTDDAQCGGLACLCGICTDGCIDSLECAEFSETAVCARGEVDLEVAQLCGARAALCAPACTPACDRGFVCAEGACIPRGDCECIACQAEFALCAQTAGCDSLFACAEDNLCRGDECEGDAANPGPCFSLFMTVGATAAGAYHAASECGAMNACPDEAWALNVAGCGP